MPAGPMAEALNRFALQAGVSIAVEAARLQGLRCGGLKGAVTVPRASPGCWKAAGWLRRWKAPWSWSGLLRLRRHRQVPHRHRLP